MSARSSIRTFRGRRAVMVGGFALCVALAPGAALADEGDPAPAPLDGVTDVLEEQQDGDLPAPEGGGEQLQEGDESSEETPEPPPFEIPPELQAALQQFADQAGFSQECVDGVTGSLEQIGNGIAGLPAELQELGTGFGEALQQSITDQDPAALQQFLTDHGLTPPEGGSPEPPTPPVGADITAGLEQLAETLQSEACQPAPPAPPAPPSNNPPAQPAAGPQPPAQNPPAAAPQQPVQQGTYPGYAPTGADDVEDGPSPAAIALAVAALAGGAVWTGRRWGAARSD